tara:strand:- start:259 stop:486 length:228 start_codon:yes stop_codon:yes gene_type:complete
MNKDQTEKLESYFTDRFKTLLEGKMLNLQIKKHRDALAIKQEYLCNGKTNDNDNYKWLIARYQCIGDVENIIGNL